MELQFIDISKNYGKKTALTNVSVTLNDGVHALLGPNGAGKSTLMNILTGLLKATSGKITLDGEDITQMGARFRDILGFLPQNPGFYNSFSGYEIMKYFADLKGLKKPQNRIDELLELVNLTEDKKRKVGQYSGGMKRRLGIAVSLLNDPKLLILDEPTAGLDPKERMRFRNIIGKLGFDKIVILATHIVSDVESISDNCLLLRSGEIVLTGSVDELKEHIKGKVFNTPMSQSEAEEYILSNACANIIKTDDTLFVHSVSDEKPFENSFPASANLEDVYMYFFNEQSKTEEEK